MKRITTLAAGVLAAGTLAACSSSTDSSTTNTAASANPSPTTSAARPASPAAGSHNTADVMFVQMMIPHHEQAIEMADLATSRASSPAVKRLAQQIRAAQGPEITQMKGWLREWDEPSMMSSRGHDMGGMDVGDMHDSATSMPGMMSNQSMTQLRRLSGTAFDRAFLTGMISHHEGAIRMAERIQRNGRNPQVKQLAGNIASSQAAEITQMRGMLQQQ